MPKQLFRVSLMFFLCVANRASAQGSEKTAAAKPDYSQEAAVIEQYSHKIKFENDGTSVQEEYARIRVQSDAGVQRYGLLAFSYASGVGPFEIDFIRVRKPDGTTVQTPSESVQDMAAEITRQAPFYSDLHEKHAAVKGLSMGDVLEYRTVTHVTKPLAPGEFWLDYTFPREGILLEEQVEVSVPRERTVNYKSPERKPTVTEAGAYRTYRWSSSHVQREKNNEEAEQAKLNWEQARGRFPQPDIRLSSFQSWAALGIWYQNLQADRVKATPEIVAKAAELTKGAADDDAKLRRTYNYVSQQFRYIGVTFGVGRYQPHAAAEVLANQYGDCKDKHTLLAALLNAEGIKAYPALISTERETDTEVPSPSQFDHVITLVPEGGKLSWLDTTGEVGAFQYLIAPLRDKRALVVWDDRPATLIQTPAELPFAAKQDFQMDAKLDEGGTLTGKAELSARGDLEFLLRSAFRATPMPQWKDLTQRISLSMGFAGEVSEVTASSPEKTDEAFRIGYKYVRKEYGDWPNRRILAPAPSLGLPPVGPELKGLAVPLWLGQPLEVSFHSQLELPSGYTLEVPAPIHVQRQFAEYGATYLLRDGKLVSDRFLRTLVSELSSSAFPEYEKFWKVVQDDYLFFMQLVSNQRSPQRQVSTEVNLFLNSFRGLPDSSSPEATRLEAQGREELGRQEYQTAISSLYRAVASDPKFVRGWVLLGELLMTLHQTDAGVDAFQKAIAADPQEAATRKIYAFALAAGSKFAEAVPVWQEYIKLAPEDADGPGYLGTALLQLKRYDEAARTLESAVKLNPERASYRQQLAAAYLGAGDTEKAVAAYSKFLEVNATPEALNQAAYEMAEAGKTPGVAVEFARKSIRGVEEDSTKIDLADLRPGDEEQFIKLASYWGTMGWVEERVGKLGDAERFLMAAWQLAQNGVAAAHLCELYEQQHKNQAALRMCRLARNRLAMEKETALYRTPELIEQNNERLERLSPGSSKTWNMGTIDEIAKMRDFKLPRVVQGTETAAFLVLFEFDPQAGSFKVQDTQYVSGSQKLKPFSKALTKINADYASPDGNPIRFVRWGNFVCGPPAGCEFILPETGSGVPIPVKVIK